MIPRGTWQVITVNSFLDSELLYKKLAAGWEPFAAQLVDCNWHYSLRLFIPHEWKPD